MVIYDLHGVQLLYDFQFPVVTSSRQRTKHKGTLDNCKSTENKNEGINIYESYDKEGRD